MRPPKADRRVQRAILDGWTPSTSDSAVRTANLLERARNLLFLRRAEWTASTIVYTVTACIIGYVAGVVT